MAKDIDSIINDYLSNNRDFGFLGVDETEHETIAKTNEESAKATAEDYKKKLQDVEVLIMPLLTNLYKTANQKYIKWDNREKPLKDLMEKILKLTRA